MMYNTTSHVKFVPHSVYGIPLSQDGCFRCDSPQNLFDNPFHASQTRLETCLYLSYNPVAALLSLCWDI